MARQYDIHSDLSLLINQQFTDFSTHFYRFNQLHPTLLFTSLLSTTSPPSSRQIKQFIQFYVILSRYFVQTVKSTADLNTFFATDALNSLNLPTQSRTSSRKLSKVDTLNKIYDGLQRTLPLVLKSLITALVFLHHISRFTPDSLNNALPDDLSSDAVPNSMDFDTIDESTALPRDSPLSTTPPDPNLPPHKRPATELNNEAGLRSIKHPHLKSPSNSAQLEVSLSALSSNSPCNSTLPNSLPSDPHLNTTPQHELNTYLFSPHFFSYPTTLRELQSWHQTLFPYTVYLVNSLFELIYHPQFRTFATFNNTALFFTQAADAVKSFNRDSGLPPEPPNPDPQPKQEGEEKQQQQQQQQQQQRTSKRSKMLLQDLDVMLGNPEFFETFSRDHLRVNEDELHSCTFTIIQLLIPLLTHQPEPSLPLPSSPRILSSILFALASIPRKFQTTQHYYVIQMVFDLFLRDVKLGVYSSLPFHHTAPITAPSAYSLPSPQPSPNQVSAPTNQSTSSLHTLPSTEASNSTVAPRIKYFQQNPSLQTQVDAPLGCFDYPFGPHGDLFLTQNPILTAQLFPNQFASLLPSSTPTSLTAPPRNQLNLFTLHEIVAEYATLSPMTNSQAIHPTYYQKHNNLSLFFSQTLDRIQRNYIKHNPLYTNIFTNFHHFSTHLVYNFTTYTLQNLPTASRPRSSPNSQSTQVPVSNPSINPQSTPSTPALQTSSPPPSTSQPTTTACRTISHPTVSPLYSYFTLQHLSPHASLHFSPSYIQTITSIPFSTLSHHSQSLSNLYTPEQYKSALAIALHNTILPQFPFYNTKSKSHLRAVFPHYPLYADARAFQLFHNMQYNNLSTILFNAILNLSWLNHPALLSEPFKNDVATSLKLKYDNVMNTVMGKYEMPVQPNPKFIHVVSSPPPIQQIRTEITSYQPSNQHFYISVINLINFLDALFNLTTKINGFVNVIHPSTPVQSCFEVLFALYFPTFQKKPTANTSDNSALTSISTTLKASQQPQSHKFIIIPRALALPPQLPTVSQNPGANLHTSPRLSTKFPLHACIFGQLGKKLGKIVTYYRNLFQLRQFHLSNIQTTSSSISALQKALTAFENTAVNLGKTSVQKPTQHDARPQPRTPSKSSRGKNAQSSTEKRASRSSNRGQELTDESQVKVEEQPAVVTTADAEEAKTVQQEIHKTKAELRKQTASQLWSRRILGLQSPQSEHSKTITPSAKAGKGAANCKITMDDKADSRSAPFHAGSESSSSLPPISTIHSDVRKSMVILTTELFARVIQGFAAMPYLTAQPPTLPTSNVQPEADNIWSAPKSSLFLKKSQPCASASAASDSPSSQPPAAPSQPAVTTPYPSITTAGVGFGKPNSRHRIETCRDFYLTPKHIIHLCAQIAQNSGEVFNSSDNNHNLPPLLSLSSSSVLTKTLSQPDVLFEKQLVHDIKLRTATRFNMYKFLLSRKIDLQAEWAASQGQIQAIKTKQGSHMQLSVDQATMNEICVRKLPPPLRQRYELLTSLRDEDYQDDFEQSVQEYYNLCTRGDGVKDLIPTSPKQQQQQQHQQQQQRPSLIPLSNEINSMMIQNCVEYFIDLLLDPNTFHILSEIDFSASRSTPTPTSPVHSLSSHQTLSPSYPLTQSAQHLPSLLVQQETTQLSQKSTLFSNLFAFSSTIPQNFLDHSKSSLGTATQANFTSIMNSANMNSAQFNLFAMNNIKSTRTIVEVKYKPTWFLNQQVFNELNSRIKQTKHALQTSQLQRDALFLKYKLNRLSSSLHSAVDSSRGTSPAQFSPSALSNHSTTGLPVMFDPSQIKSTIIVQKEPCHMPYLTALSQSTLDSLFIHFHPSQWIDVVSQPHSNHLSPLNLESGSCCSKEAQALFASFYPQYNCDHLLSTPHSNATPGIASNSLNSAQPNSTIQINNGKLNLSHLHLSPPSPLRPHTLRPSKHAQSTQYQPTSLQTSPLTIPTHDTHNTIDLSAILLPSTTLPHPGLPRPRPTLQEMRIGEAKPPVMSARTQRMQLAKQTLNTLVATRRVSLRDSLWPTMFSPPHFGYSPRQPSPRPGSPTTHSTPMKVKKRRPEPPKLPSRAAQDDSKYFVQPIAFPIDKL